MFGLTSVELKLLRRLRTPQLVQDFLETLPANFERRGETCLSPRQVLREHRAHCIEGAMLAAAALRLQGHKPLLMDLKSVWHDDDHVVALFRRRGLWGAISKTNHAVLRYREPIYRTLRELALSYFHEYFTDDGKKTLRSYSRPVNLKRFDKRGWMTADKDVWYIPRYLDRVRHYPLVSRTQIKHLRPADPIEIKAGKLMLWPR